MLTLVPAREGADAELFRKRDDPVLSRADPLAADLDHGAILERVVERSAADPLLCLEHDDVATRPAQIASGGQPREAPTDDRDVNPLGAHPARYQST